MIASVGVINIARRRAAAMPAVWVQLAERIDGNLFARSSKRAVEFTLPPLKGVPRTLTPGEKQPGREADCIHFVPRLTHCGRVTQICVFNTVNLGTSANSR